jgi:hypothetical protein
MIKSYSLLQLLAGIGALWVTLVIFFYPKPDQIVSVADVLFQAKHGEFFDLENRQKLEAVEAEAMKAEVDVNAVKLIEDLMNKNQAEAEVKPLKARKQTRFSKPPNIFNNDSVGEFGIAWKMPPNLPDNIQRLFDEGWKNHQFNQYLSDLISVQRNLLDKRPEYCHAAEATYSKNLPATSVIIIFHNEAWSTLLRSVHSVLDRSPEHLIHEVLLVDDFSDMGKLVAFSRLGSLLILQIF